MRIAVLSDPHGDFVAFEKVIEDLARTGPFDEVLVGGDIAQGGAQPDKVVDEIRRRGWRSVIGNSDQLLIRIAEGMSSRDAARPAELTHGQLPPPVLSRARWSVRRLGNGRIDYLRSLPTMIEIGMFPFGRAVLVHATPWSTEDVVLPDAEPESIRRMLEAADARIVLYGHIHTPYQRRIDVGAVASVGAIIGSNDQDPRPAYTAVTLGARASVQVHRVDWPADERSRAYRTAGVEERFNRSEAGPFPIRSKAGVDVALWP